MSRLPYRAVIVDFDRTLLHTDKTISPNTIRVLEQWQRAGARLFAATARPERSIMAYCRQIAFDGVTTLNGARTILPDAVRENPIRREEAEAILRQLCAVDGAVVSVETANGFYANAEIPEWQPTVLDDLLELPGRVSVYKILASHPEIPADEIPVELPRDTYTTVAERKLLQVMSRAATKWNGIRDLLDAAGIPPEEAVYFGDDQDDLEPIRLCGCGVAVRNALPCVREIADHITLSNDEDGVAAFLAEIADF